MLRLSTSLVVCTVITCNYHCYGWRSTSGAANHQWHIWVARQHHASECITGCMLVLQGPLSVLQSSSSKPTHCYMPRGACGTTCLALPTVLQEKLPCNVPAAAAAAKSIRCPAGRCCPHPLMLLHAVASCKQSAWLLPCPYMLLAASCIIAAACCLSLTI